MATGKERGFKDWKGSKAFRESQRGFEVPEEIKRGAKKKNTRKWCKGKEGRKHSLARYNRWSGFYSRKCINCGKDIWGPINEADFNIIDGNWEDYRI